MDKTIAFLSPQLCERGTTVALYDYALAHEKTGGISIILYSRLTHKDILTKFQQAFQFVIQFQTMAEVEKLIAELNIDGLYVIKYGHFDQYFTEKIPCLIHSVFAYQPHGKYACVSKKIAEDHKAVWLPHIVSRLVSEQEEPLQRKLFREKYQIPSDAYVYGRHGGYDTFSIDYVKQLISEEIDLHPNIWFVFLNTEKFTVHPRVLFLPATTSLSEKGSFLAGCDAMIHARKEGETFGLAVAEFGILNKPILTCPATITNDNAHILLGKDRVKIFTNREECQQLLWKIPHLVSSTDNPYLEFGEEKVMKIFYQTIFE